MADFTKVATVAEIPSGSGKVIQIGDQDVALFNVDGEFYAMDNTCTHVGGPLGEGELEGSTVTCPWHGAQFNVKTGEVTGPPAGEGVKSFSVKVEGDDILVSL